MIIQAEECRQTVISIFWLGSGVGFVIGLIIEGVFLALFYGDK